MPKVKRSKARWRARKLMARATSRKGMPMRKVIGRLVAGNCEYWLHATKGYRYQRLAGED